jgi:hypothetical protein
MPSLFQELDYRPTDLGALILRRRWEPRLSAFIHEIKLGGDFVMTSAVTASEVALAERGLAALAQTRRVRIRLYTRIAGPLVKRHTLPGGCGSEAEHAWTGDLCRGRVVVGGVSEPP